MTSMLIPLEEVPRLGIQAIDAEHVTIVRLVNELHAGMLDSVGRQALQDVLHQLISETHAHFATEEALMREHDYPDYAHHKSEHDRLLAHVSNLERRFREGERLLSFAIMLDLKNWAMIHIDRSDKPLGEFLRAQGVK